MDIRSSFNNKTDTWRTNVEKDIKELSGNITGFGTRITDLEKATTKLSEDVGQVKATMDEYGKALKDLQNSPMGTDYSGVIKDITEATKKNAEATAKNAEDIAELNKKLSQSQQPQQSPQNPQSPPPQQTQQYQQYQNGQWCAGNGCPPPSSGIVTSACNSHGISAYDAISDSYGNFVIVYEAFANNTYHFGYDARRLESYVDCLEPGVHHPIKDDAPVWLHKHTRELTGVKLTPEQMEKLEKLGIGPCYVVPPFQRIINYNICR